ncbi:MAG: glycosyltransferase [Candidatus Krumholzibacteria bacterium]|nr:glycosyltransferase [Candidatus Krumholzibacteria bacterium]
MRATRVLMVTSERTWRGGERQLHLLMRGLREEGVEVALAAPERSVIAQRARNLGVQAHALSFRGAAVAAAPGRLRALASGFDVVHAHASRAHGVVAAAWAGRGRRPLRVVSRRAAGRVGRGVGAALKYRRGADLYLAVSGAVRDDLVAGGVRGASIRVVADGIDLEALRALDGRERLRERLGWGAQRVVVGQVAALTPEKGQRDLVHAARAVCAARADAHFVIVGDGPLRARLEALARSLGVGERVTFAGFREDALSLLKVFDCFVASSRREGLGSSIMDAHALGVPVVATRTGGIPELVADGETGLLAPPADAEALAGAILRMLGDEGLRGRCTAAGLARSTGYDYRQMVYNTLNAYRALLPGDSVRTSPEKGGTST